MKKLYIFIVMILSLCVCLNVNAQSYKTGELIPVGTSATVDTDLFTYNDIVFNTTDGKVKFGSIRNNSNSKVPVSINILLFDKDKINIGFLSYCSTYDYSSDYSQVELGSKAVTPFYINVTKKYFHKEDEKLRDDEIITYNDVSYIAVLDDNHNCNTGGPTKYKGLTIEKILNGEVNSNAKERFDLYSFSVEFLNSADAWKTIIFIVLFILVIMIAQGMVLNALYERMYLKSSGWAYLPIGCNYISIKLAFGDLLGRIYLIAYLGSVLLSFVGIGTVLAILLSLVSTVAFIVVIFKLITKKYDLFLIGKHEAVNMTGLKPSTLLFKKMREEKEEKEKEYKEKEEVSLKDRVVEEIVKEEDNKEDKDSDVGIFFNQNVEYLDEEEKTKKSFFGNTEEDLDLEEEERLDLSNDINNSKNNDGESDLSNLFK